jgi:hypothetical protein
MTTDTHLLKDVKNTDIALVPQPSDDVNDPLNWCKWKKSVAFLCVCFYAFLGSWIMGGVTLGIPGIMTEFDVGLNNVVNGLISWIVLTLGVGVVSKSHAMLTRRTSSGLPLPFTSARDLSFSSLRSSLSPGQFGVRRLNRGPACEPVELLVPLRSLPVKASQPPLKQICSSFMSGVGGWVST